jgi:hypothetical protein
MCSGAACQLAVGGLSTCLMEIEWFGTTRMAGPSESLERVIARQLRVEHLSSELLRRHAAARGLGKEPLGNVVGKRHKAGLLRIPTRRP